MAFKQLPAAPLQAVPIASASANFEPTMSQRMALEALDEFIDSTSYTFLLQGAAGVGKTRLLSEFIRQYLLKNHRIVGSAPTHKACRVLRTKLSNDGIKWLFKPVMLKKKDGRITGHVIIDTTAALLGMVPVVDDDQEDEEEFRETGHGSLMRLLGLDDFASVNAPIPILVIDEVSMVSRASLRKITQATRGRAKLVAVGDSGQLPPVKSEQIDFNHDFERVFELTEIVRQAKDSGIIKLAWSIRRGEPLSSWLLDGSGIVRAPYIGSAFLSEVALPVDDEDQRTVFIAYTNASIDAVQDAACQKLYGHGRMDFQKGQLVLSESAIQETVNKSDQLRILSVESKVDPMFGYECRLDRVDLPKGSYGREFYCYYLPEKDFNNFHHPFNSELRKLQQNAFAAKRVLHSLLPGDHRYGEARKVHSACWKDFFNHQKKVISFAHPFAITAYKAQGSSYSNVYVLASELMLYNSRSMYVACTRAVKTLVL